jgi:poly [ADP-ribose] polymerase
LTLLEDKKEVDRIKKLYNKTRLQMHSCRHLKVKNVYNVHIETMARSFDKDGAKLDPVWELWHGTRTANLLSILKCGLVIPPANAAHCTGRMFGAGAYFSDQATKALNYAYGYWGGQRDNNCFMFLADVGMGKSYTPPGPIRKKPAGYDSVYAIGGRSGVSNNEMIVPRVSMCNLKRLVEFTA